jgi:hypothetical protein
VLCERGVRRHDGFIYASHISAAVIIPITDMSSHAPYKVHIDQGAQSDNKLCNERAPIFYASIHKRQIARSVELHFAEIATTEDKFSNDNNSSLGILHGTKPWRYCTAQIKYCNLISISRRSPSMKHCGTLLLR